MIDTHIRRIPLLLLITAATLSSAELPIVDPQIVGLSEERLQHIDALAQNYIDEGRMPGAVVAVARYGRVAKLRGVGGFSTDSIFPI